MKVLSIGLIAAGLMLAACGKPACKTPDAPPSYTNDGIVTIVKDYCLQCHTSRGTPKTPVPDGSFYNTYDGIANVADAAGDRVNQGTMPQAPEPQLSAGDKEKFVQWAVCGAKE